MVRCPNATNVRCVKGLACQQTDVSTVRYLKIQLFFFSISDCTTIHLFIFFYLCFPLFFFWQRDCLSMRHEHGFSMDFWVLYYWLTITIIIIKLKLCLSVSNGSFPVCPEFLCVVPWGNWCKKVCLRWLLDVTKHSQTLLTSTSHMCDML